MLDRKNVIKQSKKNTWRVCCYGLGHMGKRLNREIPGIFGLKPELFCDGNSERVETFALEGAVPIFLDELLNAKDDILVFVLVDDPQDKAIKENLSVNPYLHVLTLRDLLESDKVMRHYFGKELFDIYSELNIQRTF